MSDTNKKPQGMAQKREQDIFGDNSEIARSLRSYYGTLVSEDVPDRFTDLLNKLETAETVRKKD